MSDQGQGQFRETRQQTFVTVTVAGQLFGIPVLQVQDVLGAQRITHIPLAPSEVAGSLNLRGRIVTAIDVRTRLGLPPRDDGKPGMSVVVEHQHELYSLIVDAVGEVLDIEANRFERNPSTLETVWGEATTGIFRLEDSLLLILDVSRLLDLQKAEAA